MVIVVPIIFPFILQTVINFRMLLIGERREKKKEELLGYHMSNMPSIHEQ